MQSLAWRELLRDEGLPQRQLTETQSEDEKPRGAGVRTDRRSESSGTTSLAWQVKSRSGASHELTPLDSQPEKREQGLLKARVRKRGPEAQKPGTEA